MTGLTREEWMDINKNFLVASLNVIKAELAYYHRILKNENKISEAEFSLEKATSDLRQLEEELSVIPSLKSLVNQFQLSSFEEKILLMCIGVELDVQFIQLIQKLQGDSGQAPTFGLALAAFKDAHWSALTPESPVRFWHLIEVTKDRVLSQAVCKVDEHILHHVMGLGSLDYRIRDYFKLVVPDGNLVTSHHLLASTLYQELSPYMKEGNYPLIQLKGNSHKEKVNIIAEAFARLQVATYRLPIQLIPTNYSELIDLVRLWNRDAVLYGHVLFLDDDQEDINDQKTNHLIRYMIENIQHILVLGSERKIGDFDRELLNMEINKPTQEEQKDLWKQQLSGLAVDIDGAAKRLVSQFNLNSNVIKKLAKTAIDESKQNGNTGKEVKDRLWQICCTHTRPNLGHLAHRIDPIAKWDDLVLPEMQKDILKEIAVHVQQRQKVYFEWGFAQKSGRGLGISALFSGESGTGKTMASEVLANELNLDLFRIDLSQVINKYIGETEKNLKKIFEAAEGSGAILLFDEADALFGKRSDVKDSHDRYANIEVSYLLQKMEEYRGLAILTTNMKNALDKAFLRRIRFVVQFPFPDVKLRTEIWKRTFPQQTPKEEFDYQKLAALNIPGGNIRNIAINASFTAASENRPVSMQDIQTSARNEYRKLDKQMSASESLQ